MRRFRWNRGTGQWRGNAAFRGRPRWVPVTVVLIMLTEGMVSGWNIGRSAYNSYYADSARSMSLSWHALLFGAFDPGATVTLDKLSGFLVPQVLSTWIFGFHPWSTMLPQVVEGMVTVLAAFVIAARWQGPAAGLLAAAAAATTPLLVSMFGRSSEDAMITMSLALAFWCWQSAVLSGRLLPLLGSCGWIAVGFQSKMAQAWFIVPALALGYLIAGPHPVGQRLRRAAVAGLVTTVLSLSWMTAMAITPAAERPYVDGTTNNNPYTMVFGYNGFNRVVPNLLPGVIGGREAPLSPRPRRPDLTLPIIGHSQGGSVLAWGSKAPPAPGSRGTPVVRPKKPPVGPNVPGFDRLLMPLYSTQVGWLYPSALAGGLIGILPLLRRRRTRSELTGGAWDPESEHHEEPDADVCGDERGALDQRSVEHLPAGGTSAAAGDRSSTGTAGALLLWLVIDAVFLSTSGIPHISYLSAVSVQIAVLAGAGAVQAARLRNSHSVVPRTIPAVLVLTQTAWILLILATSGVAPVFVAPVVAVCGLCAGLALLPAVPLGRGAGRVVTALAVGAVLLAPAVWSAFSITAAASYPDAYGGPAQFGRYRGVPALTPRGQPFDVLTPFTRSADPVLSPVEQWLVDYLRPRTGLGPLMAIDTWRAAEPYILDQGLDVQPMGGFTGVAPTPTLAQIEHEVQAGALRYVLLHTLIPGHGGGGAYLTGFAQVPGMYDGPNVLVIRAWITTHCAPIPTTTWEGSRPNLTGETLYHCGAGAASRTR